MLVIAMILGVIGYFVGRTLWGNFLESSGLGELTGQFGGLGESGELSEIMEQLKELQNMQLPTP